MSKVTIHASLALKELSAGGPGSGRKPGGAIMEYAHKMQYVPERHAAMKAWLESHGFKNSGVNQDPREGPLNYGKTEFDEPTGGPKDNPEFFRTTHSVTLWPNGSWTHFSEGSHEGQDVPSLKRVHLGASNGNSRRKRVFV